MDAAATVPATPEEAVFKEAALWVCAHKATIPASVYTVVMLVCALRSELDRAKARAGKLLELFRKELGLTPKSERGSVPPAPAAGKTDAERLALLKARRAKLHKQIRRYEERLDLARRSKRASRGAPRSEKTSPPVAENDFKKSEETLFSGSLATHEPEKRKLSVDRVDNFENPRGLHSASDKRTRHEYGVFTKTITLEVETVTDLRTGKSVTASTDEIGPTQFPGDLGGDRQHDHFRDRLRHSGELGKADLLITQ